MRFVYLWIMFLAESMAFICYKIKQHFYPTSNMSEMEFKKFLDGVGDN